jgi:RNA polymerase sigma factor (sigma-70 family)
MRTEDAHIIHSCLNGDSSSFGLLVEKYKSKVHALAYDKLKNFHDAEDVTQEVFIKAYQNLRNLRQWDRLPAWLYSITSNQCSKWTRKQAINESYHKELKEHLSNSYPDENESLLEVLNLLPETDRQVLTLYYLSGMDSNDIAGFLGISPTAVRQRLSRARTQLKEEMIDVMRATFEQNRLPASFTFHIMEMLKHLRIHPIPRTTTLPWGISTAAGIAFLIFSFGFHLSFVNPINDMIKSNVSSDNIGETKLMKIGEFLFPFDIVKISDKTNIAKNQGDGVGSEPDSQSVFFLAPKVNKDEWARKADMPSARWCYTVEVNGKIYAIGGTPDNVNSISLVEEYNPKTDTWIKKADMPTPRDWLSVSVANGKIYAIGGMVRPAGTLLSTVEEYDPSLDKWVRKSDMPTPRCGFADSILDGKIYIIGGWGPGYISIVEEYDPILDKWTKKADMPTAKEPQACAVNGKIYVIGGFKDSKGIAVVEEYDPKLDVWTKKTDMPTARGCFGISTVKGKIYAIGGTLDLNQIYSVVEEYDPLSDKWTKKTDMKVARAYVSASVFDGKIYVIGGITLPAVMTSVVEEYTPEDWQFSVTPQNKLLTTWGQQKSKE